MEGKDGSAEHCYDWIVERASQTWWEVWITSMLSEELTVEERLDIIENEYDIPIGENIRKDQCNKFASAVKNKSDKEAIDYNIFDNNRVPINNSKKQQ